RIVVDAYDGRVAACEIDVRHDVRRRERRAVVLRDVRPVREARAVTEGRGVRSEALRVERAVRVDRVHTRLALGQQRDLVRTGDENARAGDVLVEPRIPVVAVRGHESLAVDARTRAARDATVVEDVGPAVDDLVPHDVGRSLGVDGDVRFRAARADLKGRQVRSRDGRAWRGVPAEGSDAAAAR